MPSEHLCTDVFTYMHMHMCACAQLCTCVRIPMCMCMHTCMCRCTHVTTHTYFTLVSWSLLLLLFACYSCCWCPLLVYVLFLYSSCSFVCFGASELVASWLFSGSLSYSLTILSSSGSFLCSSGPFWGSSGLFLDFLGSSGLALLDNC